MKFEYQAIDDNGGVVRGIVEASSSEKVWQILLHRHLHPLDLRELTDSTVELGRLNNLKSRLQGKKQRQPQDQPSIGQIQEIAKRVEQRMETGDKKKIDFTYPIFVCATVGVLALAILSELNLLF